MTAAPTPTPDPSPDPARVREMLWGFRRTCLMVAAVRVGLVDRLGAAPASADELAGALALEPAALLRFARALMSLGLLERRGDLIALTAAGHTLLELRDFAHLIGDEYLPAWARVDHSLRTGETAFDHVFGVSVWKHREERPDLDESLNRTMLAYQRVQVGAILATLDLSAARLLVDVGGGYGTVVVEALRKHPALQAILFDQPHVVEGALAGLAAAGMADRCRAVGGSFFESVPAGGDAYVLKHVLHNWDDAACTRILRACREAMSPASALHVVESVMPEETRAPVRDGHWDIFMLDMHMMAVLGGRERTLRQYDGLFASAGLERTRCLDAQGTASVIEARPVG